MFRFIIIGCLLFVCSVVRAQSSSSLGPAMIGRVAVSQSQIVFNYAGDLWVVNRAGGEAKRLTDHPAEDSFPAFSPDGSQLAFSRQNGGQWDVYVMPATGGEAKRLTWQPRGDTVCGWTPEGRRIVFGTSRTGMPQLATIAPDGVMPDELPLPWAWNGSYSPDAKRLAYSPNSSISDWRYYRGGDHGRIWIANTNDWSVEKLSAGTHNDEFPMWVGERIYFISDRDSIFNLFVYDLKNKQTKQLTNYEKYGIRFVSAGANAIVFVRDGRIHLHDVTNAQTKQIDVRVTPDLKELQARTVNAARTNEWAALNAKGDRVILGARGEVLLFDPATNESRNVTNTTGVAERWPAMSPDGRALAYFSDESGEYQLHIRALSGEEPVRKIAIETKPAFYRELVWSSDSKRVAFTGKRLDLWMADVERGTAMKIDTSSYSYQEDWFPRWSPDGRWLTYSKHLKNRIRTVFIYDTQSAKLHQITDGVTHTEQPVFDANGKYLYFLSSPNAGTSEFGWGVLNGIFARPLVTRRLHALLLSADGQMPLLPDNSINAEAKLGEAVNSVRIDFDNLNRRVIDLPTPLRDYSLLFAGRPGVLFALINEWPASPSPLAGQSQQMLYKLDLTNSSRLEKFADNIGGLEVSADGSRVLLGREPNWFVVSSAAVPKPDEGRLDFKNLNVPVDPSGEWKQMYRESWRIMRDWFYDANHHGLNLAELEAHYAEYLPSVTRRADLNALLNRALGHVSVSHFGVGGGDLPSSDAPSRIALLGCDYEMANGRYRFKNVLRTGRYNDPIGSVAAPLDRPGAVVNDGEYLLAVDRQDVTTAKNVYAYFENKGPGAIKLTVGANPNGDGARTISVYPIPNDAELRIANLALANRRRVEEASGGRLGYIYVGNWGPNTMDAVRGLTGYADRAGVIIDQRYNGGGITPDYLIEWLRRKPLYFYHFREGDDIATPVNPGNTTKVLIAHEQNGSAAETFAFMFKLGKVGPIVGRRTGGGGIGPYVYTPRLIDGGRVQLPNRAAYNPDGTSWGIENVGVSPDYEVDVTPQEVNKGRDPQLEKAITVALEELKKNAAPAPKLPKYPIHK